MNHNIHQTRTTVDAANAAAYIKWTRAGGKGNAPEPIRVAVITPDQLGARDTIVEVTHPHGLRMYPVNYVEHRRDGGLLVSVRPNLYPTQDHKRCPDPCTVNHEHTKWCVRPCRVEHVRHMWAYAPGDDLVVLS